MIHQYLNIFFAAEITKQKNFWKCLLSKSKYLTEEY